MKPGIYYRGECDYDSIDAVNISSLLWIGKSPKHYKHRPQKTTQPMKLGTAAHAATLEYDRFVSDFVAWNRRTEAGASAPRNGKHWDAFQKEHRGKTIITESEMVSALDVAFAVRSDSEAMKILVAGQPEVTFVWRHEATGILCKGRVDWADISPNRFLFTDLKTARDVEQGPFMQAAARLHYHVRMAWYSDGIKSALGTDEQPDTTVMAVESGKPHDTVVFQLYDDELEEGRSEYERMMIRLRQCIESDEWPGIGNGARIRYYIPKWAKNDPELEPDTELDWSK